MHFVVRYALNHPTVQPPGTPFVDFCAMTTSTHRAVIVPDASKVLAVVDMLCVRGIEFHCLPIHPFVSLPEATHGYPLEGLRSYLYHHVIQSSQPYALLQHEGGRTVLIRLLNTPHSTGRHQSIVPREAVAFEFVVPARILVWPE